MHDDDDGETYFTVRVETLDTWFLLLLRTFKKSAIKRIIHESVYIFNRNS